MKDFFKKCLIVTFFVVIAAVAILKFADDNTVFGDTVNKVKTKIKSLVENGFGDIEITEDMFWDESWVTYDIEEQDMFVEPHGVIRDVGTFTMNFEADQIAKLDFELGGCVLEVEKSADDMIHVNAENVYAMQCFSELGTFYVKALRANTKLSMEENTMRITVQIPQDISLQDVTLSLGAGAFYAKSVKAENVNVSVGAGVFRVEDFVAENLVCKVGAGQADVKGTTINKKAEFSVGAGEVVFEGYIPGDLDADCAMGNMEFSVYGSTETDHNLEMDCAAGNLTVGSYSFEGLVNEQYVDNGAAHSYKLSCAMGNLTLHFKE